MQSDHQPRRLSESRRVLFGVSWHSLCVTAHTAKRPRIFRRKVYPRRAGVVVILRTLFGAARRVTGSRFRLRWLSAMGLFRPTNLFRVIAIGCIARCTSTAVAISAGVAAAAASAQVAGPSALTPAASAAPAARRSVVVTSLSSSGAGSLRAAMTRANAGSPGSSTVIHFAVHGTITLATQLPAISRTVTIDAMAAPTYVSGGPPVVEINCNSRAGLQFAAGSDGSRLLGVAVDNASGNGVTLNASSITLNRDYIGLDLTGAAFGNHGAGVYISATSSGNLIGLNKSGATGVVANVISGNAGSGIVLSGSSGNTVVSNRIGTNAAGRSAMGNGSAGLFLAVRASDNEII